MKFRFTRFKKSTKASIEKKFRQRKLNRKLKKQKAKKLASKRKSIPSSFFIAKQSFTVIKNQWKFFAIMTAVYLALTVVLASGLNSVTTSIDDLKNSLSDLEANNYSGISGASISFLQLIGTSGSSSSGTASTIQFMIIIIQSMAIIWSVRQIRSKVKIKVKQAYYSSTAQLVPLLAVIALIFVQLIPLIIGSSLYSATVVNGLAITTEETIGFSVLCIGLALWSLRMIGSSVFALYIVTLPNMNPIESLKKARQLVRFRRLNVVRKVLFLPLVILAILSVITLPLILYLTSFAAPVFYILIALSLLYAHIYLYNLYRWMMA